MQLQLKIIQDRFPGACYCNYPASRLSTYKAGGAVELLVKPASREELSWLSAFCLKEKLPFLALGAGSNVLISDFGLNGVVALTEKLNTIEIEGEYLKAGAGVLWDTIAEKASAAGLAGIEKTSGIPGTVGGAVFMNAGAFGQEAFDCLELVEIMDRTGNFGVLKKHELTYGYRSVKGLEGLVILSAEFKLKSDAVGPLMAMRNEVLAKRVEKQPLDLPSAGSVFKRPPGDFASRLIDIAGLKGLSIGGAMVSPKHAGFIVNTGKATAADIYALIKQVQQAVKSKTGVTLELEQIPLGRFEP